MALTPPTYWDYVGNIKICNSCGRQVIVISEHDKFHMDIEKRFADLEARMSRIAVRAGVAGGMVG